MGKSALAGNRVAGITLQKWCPGSATGSHGTQQCAPTHLDKKKTREHNGVLNWRKSQCCAIFLGRLINFPQNWHQCRMFDVEDPGQGRDERTRI